MIATIGVQDGKSRRFAVQVTGYGVQGEHRVTDCYNVRQSLRVNKCGECYPIDSVSYPEDWDLSLSDVFEKSRALISNPPKRMRLVMMAVDSGGEDGTTDNAYRFWRKCRREGLGKKTYLFKGDNVRRSRLVAHTFPGNIDKSTRHARAAGDMPLHLLQTDTPEGQMNNALWRDSPGPSYAYFPGQLGSWFYDELAYEERLIDGRWSKPGRGANEAFDLLVYADALTIPHGYEKIKWPTAPEWARQKAWLENTLLEASEAASQTPEPAKKRKWKKPVTDDSSPWSTSEGWL